ncbi:MAG: site-specific DNA-methyltransferase [Treponemataceae bacterium]|nr:MAG: site-specific DNA-methyltransferase [Treponemataceae bacterium]
MGFTPKILTGNCKDTLKQIENGSVDFVLTSPPYDNLREYGGFDFDFHEIAKELFRVMKNGGVMVWIVGDAVVSGSETLTSFTQALYFKEIGFNIHDTMIYQKNNFSNPSKTRYHQIFEYMFVAAKGKPKTFNPLIDRKNVYAGYSSFGENTTRKVDGTFAKQEKRIIAEYGMRYNIWKGNTSGQENMCKHIDHPATFPLWLAKDHVKSWSNRNDIVLDPFMGSGTTGVACKELERQFIGCEIEQKYITMAKKRMAEHAAGEDVYDLFNTGTNG